MLVRSVFPYGPMNAELNRELSAKLTPGKQTRFVLGGDLPFVQIDSDSFAAANVDERAAESTVAEMIPGALAAVQKGQTVITVFHSNSERLFLKERMQPALQERLSRYLVGPEVLVSEADEDPFEVWDTQNLPVWLSS